jgi:predicted nucleotidyltransferase
MDYTNISQTRGHSLDAVVSHLQRQERVAGLLMIGTLARGELSPASDYDLVIFLRGAPQPWFVGVTTVDGRFTDLIFAAESTLEQVEALGEPVLPAHELAPVLRWLKNGQALHDPSGRVARAQQKARQRAWVLPSRSEDAYAAWFAINYNLAVTARMAAAPDPLYQQTAAVRLATYGHTDLWFGYFTLRGLPWDGDKAALRYLREYDAAFLEAYQRFITAAPDEKLAWYRRAAEMAAAPLGGLWPRDVTAVNTTQAAGIWQELIAGLV